MQAAICAERNRLETAISQEVKQGGRALCIANANTKGCGVWTPIVEQVAVLNVVSAAAGHNIVVGIGGSFL